MTQEEAMTQMTQIEEQINQLQNQIWELEEKKEEIGKTLKGFFYLYSEEDDEGSVVLIGEATHSDAKKLAEEYPDCHLEEVSEDAYNLISENADLGEAVELLSRSKLSEEIQRGMYVSIVRRRFEIVSELESKGVWTRNFCYYERI